IPGVVVLGGMKTIDRLIDLPGEIVIGSIGLLMMSNSLASAPTICRPSDGIASAVVPMLVMVTRRESEAAPPRGSLNNRREVLVLILAPLVASGRASVIRLAPYSTTYRLPLVLSSVRSNGSTKWVSPVIPVFRLVSGLGMLPSAAGVSATMSSPPL